jgi:hypothetical protein
MALRLLIAYSVPSSAMRTEERGSRTPSTQPWHPFLLSSSRAYTIHNTPSRYSVLVLRSTENHATLSASLSGLISGSTVLAQVVTGYRAAACTGNTIFSVTPACTAKCTASGSPKVMSVDMLAGSRCELYEDPDCMGRYQILDAPDAPDCNAVTLPFVQSVKCYSYQGC